MNGAAGRWKVDGRQIVLIGAAAAGADAAATASLPLFFGDHADWLAGRRADGAALYAERR